MDAYPGGVMQIPVLPFMRALTPDKKVEQSAPSLAYKHHTNWHTNHASGISTALKIVPKAFNSPIGRVIRAMCATFYTRLVTSG